MSIGTAIFLIFLIIIGAVVAWYFLVRRPAAKATTAPRDNFVPAPVTAPAPYVARQAAPQAPAPAFYDPAPRTIVDQRPVFVETYNNSTNDLTNLIIAEEIVEGMREHRREERFEEIREERREERFEEAREEHHEAHAYETPQEQYREPDRYEAPASYEAPDTSGGWDSSSNSGSGDFGSGDSGSF